MMSNIKVNITVCLKYKKKTNQKETYIATIDHEKVTKTYVAEIL